MIQEFLGTDENPFKSEYDFSFLDSYIQSVLQPPTRESQPEASAFQQTEEEEEQSIVGMEPETEEDDDFFSQQQEEEEEEETYEDYASLRNRPRRNWNGSEYNSKGEAPGFKGGVTTEGLSPDTNMVMSELNSVTGGIVVTSGRRSKEENAKVKGLPNSKHLTGDAFDLRSNPKVDSFLTSEEGRRWLSTKGYKAIDERARAGHGKHWHIQKASQKQAGGSVPVAMTEEDQFIGLNNEQYDQMILPLEGDNYIRGLDSGQPVLVEDETGSSIVLQGPEDFAIMNGQVFEQRMKYGGSKKYYFRK